MNLWLSGFHLNAMCFACLIDLTRQLSDYVFFCEMIMTRMRLDEVVLCVNMQHYIMFDCPIP